MLKKTKAQYVFARKGNDKPITKVWAYSRGQAIVLAVKKNSHLEWLNSAIERGDVEIKLAKETPLNLPPEAQSQEGDACPNCGSGPARHRTIATGETFCKDCGWIWEPDDEDKIKESIDTLIKIASAETGAQSMLKKWKTSLNTFVPVSKEVQEGLNYLLH